MNAISFDTHAAANTLGDAGFTKAQVEALVEITRQTTALPDVSILATKTDLATEIASVRSDLAQAKSELRAEIAGVKAEIAGAKVQAITIILSGMAVITAAGAVLGKLLH